MEIVFCASQWLVRKMYRKHSAYATFSDCHNCWHFFCIFPKSITSMLGQSIFLTQKIENQRKRIEFKKRPHFGEFGAHLPVGGSAISTRTMVLPRQPRYKNKGKVWKQYEIRYHSAPSPLYFWVGYSNKSKRKYYVVLTRSCCKAQLFAKFLSKSNF